MEIINRMKGFTPGINLKDIHGHVCIDLHNHQSGFTERVETDNLVTNALREIMASYVRQNIAWSNFFPLHSRALGGIMLFDGALNEYVSNVDFPGASAKIVGFAGQTTNTEETFQGSYNSLESEEIAGGFRTVWDFDTSQANGTIASLARTNNNVSNSPVYLQHTGNFSNQGYPIYYDLAERKLYAVLGSKIYSADWHFDQLSVTESFPALTPVFEEYTDIEVEETGQIMPVWARNGYTYWPVVTYNSSTQTSTVKWTRYKVSDLSFDREVLSTHSIPASLKPTFYGHVIFAVYGGYGYITSDDNTKLYKMNLTNASDVVEIPIPSGVGYRMYGEVNGALIFHSQRPAIFYPGSGSSYEFKVFSTKNTGDLGAVMPVYKSRYVYNDRGQSIGIMPNYLGTIANISPVTKTATQSMKITYTLTNE